MSKILDQVGAGAFGNVDENEPAFFWERLQQLLANRLLIFL